MPLTFDLTALHVKPQEGLVAVLLTRFKHGTATQSAIVAPDGVVMLSEGWDECASHLYEADVAAHPVYATLEVAERVREACRTAATCTAAFEEAGIVAPPPQTYAAMAMGAIGLAQSAGSRMARLSDAVDKRLAASRVESVNATAAQGDLGFNARLVLHSADHELDRVFIGDVTSGVTELGMRVRVARCTRVADRSGKVVEGQVPSQTARQFAVAVRRAIGVQQRRLPLVESGAR